jgi:hypothetical protein
LGGERLELRSMATPLEGSPLHMLATAHSFFSSSSICR